MILEPKTEAEIISNAAEAVLRLAREKRGLQTTITERDKTIRVWESVCNEAKETAENLQRYNSELLGLIDIERQSAKAAREAIGTHVDCAKKLRADLADAREDLATAIEDNQQLHDELERATNRHDHLAGVNTILQREKKEYRALNDNLQREILKVKGAGDTKSHWQLLAEERGRFLEARKEANKEAEDTLRAERDELTEKLIRADESRTYWEALCKMRTVSSNETTDKLHLREKQLEELIKENAATEGTVEEYKRTIARLASRITDLDHETMDIELRMKKAKCKMSDAHLYLEGVDGESRSNARLIDGAYNAIDTAMGTLTSNES